MELRGGILLSTRRWGERVRGADENVVWKVGKGNGDQLVWEGNCNNNQWWFFSWEPAFGALNKNDRSLVLRGLQPTKPFILTPGFLEHFCQLHFLRQGWTTLPWRTVTAAGGAEELHMCDMCYFDDVYRITYIWIVWVFFSFLQYLSFFIVMLWWILIVYQVYAVYFCYCWSLWPQRNLLGEMQWVALLDAGGNLAWGTK